MKNIVSSTLSAALFLASSMVVGIAPAAAREPTCLWVYESEVVCSKATGECVEVYGEWVWRCS